MSIVHTSQVWGGVTSPDKHDPQNFRYLVHIDSGLMSDDEEEIGPYFIDDIDAIYRVGRLSASLIDARRKRPFCWSAAHGFIIEVPVCDVVATSVSDMHSKAWSTVELQERWPVQRPEDVLKGKVGWPTNNEVVVIPENLTITGILITDPEYKWRSHSLEQVEGLAYDLSVPVVCVNPFEEN